MRVGVEGDNYGGASQHLGDYLNVDALTQEQRSAGVPQIVEPQVFPYTGALLDALEGAVAQV